MGETANLKLRTFSKESIQIEGKIQNPVMGNGWNTRFASFTVVADGLKPLTGCDLFDQLAFAVTQSTSQKGYQANFISPHSEFKEHIALKFPDPISCFERSKNHVAKSKFRKTFQPSYQRGRGVPINLQAKVNKELKKLLDNKHITNLLIALTNHLFPR